MDSLSRCILELLGQRAPAASICPSEVARAQADDEAQWRGLMPSVREAATALARCGVIEITQGGTQLDPDARAAGPIRLRRGPRFPG
ncbi:DUF3253 domain-containing protein [Xanthomonas sp. 60]